MYAFEDHHAHRDGPETNIINKRHIITFVPYKYE